MYQLSVQELTPNRLEAHLAEVERAAAPAAPERRIACGIRLGNGVWNETSVGITSPRTGLTLWMAKNRWPNLPARMIGRILSAISRGEHTAEFTREELAAYALEYEICMGRVKPQPIVGARCEPWMRHTTFMRRRRR